MDFWPSLAVEIIGGLVTAVAFGVGAAFYAASQQVRRHDAQVRDLLEDNRRWFRDRDAEVKVESQRATNEMAASGLLQSGAGVRALMEPRRRALHQYRDELSAKRRRYRELRDAEGWTHQLIRRRHGAMPQLSLTDEERTTLAAWRAELPDANPSSDPTSVEREPDLRRFEEHGDPPS